MPRVLSLPTPTLLMHPRASMEVLEKEGESPEALGGG